jgi:hypothetical protein
MKSATLLKFAIALLYVSCIANALRAAEVPAEQSKRPTREELMKMTPEERQAKLKEWRDNQQKGLTPDQREAQREAQRKVYRERIEKLIEDLNKKKADGVLTAEEAKRLERLQEMLRRFQQTTPSTPPAKPIEKPAKPAEQK